MKTEIDLKRYRQCVTENPFEYTLPLNEDDVRDILLQTDHQNHWVLQTATLPISDANLRLQQRLLLPYMSESPACQRFSEMSQCMAVVVRAGIAWILCESRFDSDHKCVFFLGNEESQEGVASKLNWNGTSGEEIANFVSAYSGFREDYPPICGNVALLKPDSNEPEIENISLVTERLPGWTDSICLYKSLTGDFLLLRPDGVCGWSVAEEVDVRIFSRSFTEFSERFFSHFTSAFYHDTEQKCNFIEPFDPFCDKSCCQ